MSTGQRSMQSAVRAVFCAAMLSAACLAGATPPTRAAVLEIAREPEFSRVQVRDGAFEVPFRIVRNGEVSRLAVHVRVRSTDPLDPADVDPPPPRGRRAQDDDVALTRTSRFGTLDSHWRSIWSSTAIPKT